MRSILPTCVRRTTTRCCALDPDPAAIQSRTFGLRLLDGHLTWASGPSCRRVPESRHRRTPRSRVTGSLRVSQTHHERERDAQAHEIVIVEPSRSSSFAAPASRRAVSVCRRLVFLARRACSRRISVDGMPRDCLPQSQMRSPGSKDHRFTPRIAAGLHKLSGSRLTRTVGADPRRLILA